ncbi:MAG: FtsW/RodA/SpoVE family cell cycle protein [Bacillota bacterium]
MKNSYARLLISGFVVIFAIQFLWNMAMNLGLAPISEVGLPFISYGGSQLTINAFAKGIILSIYRRKNLSSLKSLCK